jgi:hypothetical protein
MGFQESKNKINTTLKVPLNSHCLLLLCSSDLAQLMRSADIQEELSLLGRLKRDYFLHS